MSMERRYNEREIAAIFKQAATDQESAHQRLSRGGGLTLAEIEQIGEEVGITPEFIARAAAAVHTATPLPVPPPATSLGVPVSVARTLDLPGEFSDEDWDRLVADLHETFQVPGDVQLSGSLRKWRNGELQVLVEPTESGHRLRFHSLNETHRGALLGGLILLVMGLFFMLLVAAKGDFGVDLAKTLMVSLFAVVGLGSMGTAAFRLPRWREAQERQIEEVAARAVRRAGAKSVDNLRAQDPSHLPSLDLPMDPEEEKEQNAVPRKIRS
jgi:hypothetical protein